MYVGKLIWLPWQKSRWKKDIFSYSDNQIYKESEKGK